MKHPKIKGFFLGMYFLNIILGTWRRDLAFTALSISALGVTLAWVFEP